MNRKIIGFRTEEFKTFSVLEEKVKRAVDELKGIAGKVLNKNKVEDWNSYLNDPLEYLAQRYFELYGKNEPPNAMPLRFLKSKVDIDERRLKIANNTFWQSSQRMREYAPIIEDTRVVFNLKEEDFNIYLNPEKKADYDAVKTFFDAAMALKEKGLGKTSINLVRYAEGVVMGNNGAEINPYYFQ